MTERCPEVSVILTTDSDPVQLCQSLASIAAQASVTLEVILCGHGKGIDPVAPERLETGNPACRIVPLTPQPGHAPLGEGAARNAGLARASGRHVLFLCAGDLLTGRDVLARLRDFALAENCEIAVAPAPGDLPRRASDGALIPPACGAGTVALYDRAFLARHGLRFAEGSGAEDGTGLAIAAEILAARVGVFDRPVAVRAAPAPADQPEAAALLASLQTIAAALEAVGAKARTTEQQETRAALNVLTALRGRWRAVWQGLDQSSLPADRALASQIMDHLTAILRNSGPLWPRGGDLVLDARAEEDRASGRLDLIRAAVLVGDADLLRDCLAEAPLPLGRLYDLASGTGALRAATLRAAAHRALAFYRNAHLGQPAKAQTTALPRIILHVGGMKTGSSALQNFLEQNRAALVGQGFLYPTTGTFRESGLRSERNPGHALLVSSLLQPGRRAAMLQALRAEIAAQPSPPHTLLISAETIVSPGFWMQGQGFARIAALLGSPVEVVWLHRQPTAWLASIHREEASNPHVRHPTLADLTEAHATAGLLDNASVATILRAPGNVTRLHVAAHEDIRARPGGTTEYFCGLASIDSRGFDPLAETGANLSLSDAQAGMITLLKRIPGLGAEAREEGFRRITNAQGPLDGVAIFTELLADVARTEAARAAAAPAKAAAPQWSETGLRLFPLVAGGACLALPRGPDWRSATLVCEGCTDADLPILSDKNFQFIVIWQDVIDHFFQSCRTPSLMLRADAETIACPLALSWSDGAAKLSLADPAPPMPLWLPRQGRAATDPAQAEILLLPRRGQAPDAAATLARAFPEDFPQAAWQMAPGFDWRLAAQQDQSPDWREFFDGPAYLVANPDVAAAGVDAATHHAAHGWREGRRLSADLSAEDLRRMLGPRLDPATDPFAQAVACGLRVTLPAACLARHGALAPTAPELATPAGSRPSERESDAELVAAAIDPAFYAAQAGLPLADAGATARHYLATGWKAGFDPHPEFSSDLYALTHVDVLAAEVAPFAHYLRHGRAEGRRSFTVAEVERLLSLPAALPPDDPDAQPPWSADPKVG